MKNLIGDRVREARRKRKPKITQTELLAKLELYGICLESTAISKIETFRRPVTDIELVALAECLNVDIMWLLHKE